MKLLVVGYGYVGSFLVDRLRQENHAVTVCEARPDAVPDGIDVLSCRYQDLADEALRDTDCILWFAGHSNVAISLSDPDGALTNNCLDLLTLARRKPPATRLIYASTASLYSVEHHPGSGAPEAVPEGRTRLNPINPYDCSKVALDTLATCFAENLTGLRMGTVSGWSPRLRPELVFNAMNIAAIETGRLKLSNAHAWRSILFLDDLVRLISVLVAASSPLPKIINAASASLSIGQLAESIAGHYGAEIDMGLDSPTYSFRIDTALAESLAGAPRPLSIAERCVEFAEAYRRTCS